MTKRDALIQLAHWFAGLPRADDGKIHIPLRAHERIILPDSSIQPFRNRIRTIADLIHRTTLVFDNPELIERLQVDALLRPRPGIDPRARRKEESVVFSFVQNNRGKPWVYYFGTDMSVFRPIFLLEAHQQVPQGRRVLRTYRAARRALDHLDQIRRSGWI